MAGYISELHYDGSKSVDFFEVAVPEGTDTSGYTLAFYDSGGDNYNTKPLGTAVATMVGHDVYVLDSSTSFFPDSRDGHGIALVDGTGTVVQFVSYGASPSTITAANGAAAGLTSTYIGGASNGSSLETTDGGASYAVQTTENPGTIPCYAPGMMIDTQHGPRAVETLQIGDLVRTLDHGLQPIRWVRRCNGVRAACDNGQQAVKISAGALGPGRPERDMIVSQQHRVLVGGHGQIASAFGQEAFVPAKSLTSLRGIRLMRGKRRIDWIHFACDRHEVVLANGCLTETLLLGPMVVNGLPLAEKAAVHDLFGTADRGGGALNGPAARPCLTVGEARAHLLRVARAKDKLTADHISKWDVDRAMEQFEAEQLRLAPCKSGERKSSAA